MNIFVSSLSFKAKKEDLVELFAPFGEVLSARIILNKETRRSRGYGFVEMANDQEALAAIDALNGSEHMGRTINVAVANERPAQPAPAPAPEE
jgi:RNA recognition motif-containing protein